MAKAVTVERNKEQKHNLKRVVQLQRRRTRGWQHHQPAPAGPQNWASEDFAAAAAVAAAAAAAAETADAAVE